MDSAVVDIPRDHRVSEFLSIGFSETQAEALADARTIETARDSKGVRREWYPPLYHGKVRQMLDQGATYEQICRIFL